MRKLVISTIKCYRTNSQVEIEIWSSQVGARRLGLKKVGRLLNRQILTSDWPEDAKRTTWKYIQVETKHH
ncbi:hypothetical protein K443DRAFT_682093 [Laccaria amethystina LaAM-08-1]|uniref:Uncharacterized protein n=1 Tax=Laccaria amethystina LaAM-08-1 TaxID=1095629 RepID=A0A0C9WKV4_9AGAR|nr:hypothetical protein K443DRAFT_682093 [Laccaria amethystina LaAM-08-1]